MEIWFVEPERNRRVSFDDVYRIDILNGGIRIYCLDGFSTILRCSEKIEVVGVTV